MTQPEVLETGRERPARSHRRTIAAVAVLAVLAGGLWIYDRGLRGDETAALARCEARAEGATRSAEAKVSMMRTYITPVLGSDASEETRRGLFALVREQAVKNLPAVRAALATCRDVRIRFWHSDLQQRRNAYLKALEPRVGTLEKVSRGIPVTP